MNDGAGYSRGLGFHSQLPTWWLTALCQLQSRGLDTLFWLPLAPGIPLAQWCTDTHKQNTHILIK